MTMKAATGTVWLAQKNQAGVLGIFTSPARARKACQNQADEYFGACSGSALTWQGSDEAPQSAGYYHPVLAGENWVFTITPYALDETQENS